MNRHVTAITTTTTARLNITHGCCFPFRKCIVRWHFPYYMLSHSCHMSLLYMAHYGDAREHGNVYSVSCPWKRIKCKRATNVLVKELTWYRGYIITSNVRGFCLLVIIAREITVDAMLTPFRRQPKPLMDSYI